MSEEVSDHRSADALKTEAAAWLERRERDDWKPADQEALDKWLEEAMAHSVAFWRLEAGWARTERLAVLRGSSRPEILGPTETRWPRIAWIAATIGFAATLGIAGANYELRSREKLYATATGGHEIVTLDDGSSIELNTNTALRVALDGNTRLVTLDRGEAYFQVSHNSARPFIVNASGHRVVDLGTKFLLRNQSGQVEVALYEGRAAFETIEGIDPKQKTVLSPGDVVVATATSMTITNKPAHILVNELAWQRGFLVLDHTTLEDAARDLNRYNHQQIVITDPVVARMQMYGTIPINGVDGFTRVAQGVLGLSVIKRGDETVISR